MGRHSEFKEEYISQVDEYLASCIDKEPYRDSEGQQIERTVKIPTVEGFALFLGVNKSSLYKWEAEQSEDFSDALDKIRIEQRERLINNGLANRYNSTIAKLVLSANHGMSEKRDIDLTSNKKELKNLTEINKALDDFN